MNKSVCFSKTAKPIDNPVVENFDFSEALESIYPLLEIVFSFLNCNDLKTAAKVKPTWQIVAEKTLERRVGPSWIQCYRDKHVTNIVKHSKNLTYNNVGIGIILYDSRKTKLNTIICLRTNTSEYPWRSVVDYLSKEVVPQAVDYCLISCPKVNSFFDAESRKYQINPIFGSTFDGIFIPVIPNIRTTMFHCNLVNGSDISRSVKHYIKPNEEVKCLLLFCTNDLHKSIYNLLDFILPDSNPQSVAVGGGIIRGTRTFQRVNPPKKSCSNNDTFCIAFMQERSTESEFGAFSVVINGDDLSKDEFEYEVINFKNRVALRTHSIAIRICCSAKIDSDDELVIFNKVFENVPLLGLNADGEIGWNCLLPSTDDSDIDLGESKSKKTKHNRIYPQVQHQWSTVIVLVTWGHLQNKRTT